MSEFHYIPELSWTIPKIDNEDFGFPRIEEYVDDIFSPIRNFLVSWYCYEDSTAMAQIIIAFVYGLVLSPWSQGLFFLTGSVIGFELICYIFTKGDPKYYNLFIRAGVICSSVLGFIIGRSFSMPMSDAINSGFD